MSVSEENNTNDANLEISETAQDAVETNLDGDASCETNPDEAVEVEKETVADASNKDSLVLAKNGDIVWNDVIIAKLLKGKNLLEPELIITSEDLQNEETSKAVKERLDAWLKDLVKNDLGPLVKLKASIDFIAPIETSQTPVQEEASSEEATIDTEQASEEVQKPVIKPQQRQLSDTAKHIAVLLFNNNGIIDRQEIDKEIASLSQDNRRELRNIGVRFGRAAIYLPLMIKPKAARTNAIFEYFAKSNDGEGPFLPPVGVTSFDAPEGIADSEFTITGFKKIGNRAVRFDIADRIMNILYDTSKEAKGAFPMPLSVVSLLGVSNDTAEHIVENLGFAKETNEEEKTVWRLKRVRPPREFNREFTKRDNTDDSKREFKPRKDFTSPNSGPRPNTEGFSKKRKDFNKGKPKQHRDFIDKTKKIDGDSPFAVLAALKANLDPKKD